METPVVEGRSLLRMRRFSGDLILETFARKGGM
jgi:hypothetical protein